jgi:hypothetical protein
LPLSLSVFAQNELLPTVHAVVPAAQEPQTPLRQACPAEHVTPHPPQLPGSNWVATHEPLHAVVPFPHVEEHFPDEQYWPPGHTVPHVPQFCGSNWVLVQVAPHRVAPPAQVVAQLPCEQTCVPGQAFPHTPQLAGSLDRSLHAPPHMRSPALHCVADPSVWLETDAVDPPQPGTAPRPMTTHATTS